MKIEDVRPPQKSMCRPVIGNLPYGLYYGTFGKAGPDLYLRHYGGLASVSKPVSTWTTDGWDHHSTEDLQLVDCTIRIERNL